jgi:hypothetical protein
MDKENTGVPARDSFIFSGNFHESVPRALFLDTRLTPLERNAWQVIRMKLEPDGVTALPTYEQLRPYLTSMPYAQKASFETVARALKILRLTRWLSLVRKRRAKDGSKQSNVYVLHDEPLTPFEAMRLDDDYFSLVSQSMAHASKAIQRVAQGVLHDIAADPFLAGKRLPTRLEVLMGRASAREDVREDRHELSTGHKSEERSEDILRNQSAHVSQSEAGLKPAQTDSLRIARHAVSSSNKNKKIQLQDMDVHLEIPERFYHLGQAQQRGVLTLLQHLSCTQQQQVLNEWNERCQGNTVRNPAAYLYGIVQKACRGEFNELLHTAAPQVRPSAPPSAQPCESLSESSCALAPPRSDTGYASTPQEKLKIQQHIQHIKALIATVRQGTSMPGSCG